MFDFVNCPVDDTSWVLHDAEGNTHPIQHTAELAYARLKIAEGRLGGYYLTRDGDDNSYKITRYGTIINWPKGLFDSYENMVGDIMEASMLSAKIDKQIVDDFLNGKIEIEHLIETSKNIFKSDGHIATIKYIMSEFEKKFDFKISLTDAKKYYDSYVRNINTKQS